MFTIGKSVVAMGLTRSLRPVSFSLRSFTVHLRPIMASDLDHVCIVAKDVDASIKWYKSVLGMEHTFTNADNFYPTCRYSPAFLKQGGAKIAIAPLEHDHTTQFKGRKQFGEHFALSVSREEFRRAEKDLSTLLLQNSPPNHNIEIEACDYGHQLSLFFHDLDNNIVELTTWVDPTSTVRLSSK